MTLAVARLERANELFEEAEELLNKSKYKSANNRAFFAIEKCMKALLAVKNKDAKTHNGCLKQFNIHFIKEGNDGFNTAGYKKLS